MNVTSKSQTLANKAVMRLLLKGAALQLFNQLLAFFITLFMTPFLLNNLGERQMGMWILVASFAGFYGVLDLGITNAINRYITVAYTQNDDDSCNSYANIGFFLFLGVGFVALLISFLVACGMYFIYRASVGDILLLASVTFLMGINFTIDLPSRVMQGILNGFYRSDLVNLRAIIFRLISVATMYFLVRNGGKVVSIAVGTICVSLLNFLCYYALAKKVFPQFMLSLKKIRKSDIKVLFSYSLISFWSHAIDIVRFQLGGIIIAFLLAVEVVAHYNIATSITSYFQLFMGTCTGWLVTWFTRLVATSARDTLRVHLFFSYKIVIVISSFVAFGTILWAPAFIERWVGAKYLDAYPALVLLTLGMTVAIWQTPAVRALFAMAQHRYFAISNTLDAILNIGLTLILTPFFGMLGVALGSSIAMFITKIFVLPQMIVRVMQYRFWEYWKHLSFSVFRSALCLIAPYFITRLIIAPSYANLCATGTICAVVYSISAFFLCFSRGERKKLLSSLKRKSENVQNDPQQSTSA